MRLTWGNNEAIAEFIGRKFPQVHEQGGLRFRVAIGIETNEGELRGAVAMSEFRGHDGTLNIFMERPVLTPSMIRQMCDLAFRKMKMKRLTAHCEKKNRRARRLVEGIGFQFEGTMKHGGAHGRDHLVVYGMTHDNCRWLT